MSRQAWGEAIFWVTEPETPIVNSVVETRLYSDVIIPAAYMSDGRILRLTAFGSFKSTVASSVKFTLKLGSVILCTSDIIATPASANVKCWGVEYLIQTLTNGRVGTIIAFGDAIVGDARQLHGVAGQLNPASITADLLTELPLGLYGQWANADAGNILTGMPYVLESLN